MVQLSIGALSSVSCFYLQICNKDPTKLVARMAKIVIETSNWNQASSWQDKSLICKIQRSNTLSEPSWNHRSADPRLYSTSMPNRYFSSLPAHTLMRTWQSASLLDKHYSREVAPLAVENYPTTGGVINHGHIGVLPINIQHATFDPINLINLIMLLLRYIYVSYL